MLERQSIGKTRNNVLFIVNFQHLPVWQHLQVAKMGGHNLAKPCYRERERKAKDKNKNRDQQKWKKICIHAKRRTLQERKRD